MTLNARRVGWPDRCEARGRHRHPADVFATLDAAVAAMTPDILLGDDALLSLGPRKRAATFVLALIA
jgi:hypothetical protein